MTSKFVIPLAAVGVAGALALGTYAPAAHAASDKATVIELTQTGCQFVEIEGTDHGYQPKSAKDCVAINKKTGDERLENSKVLKLKPGKYVFRVTNKNVPYELGFWVREHDYNWKNPVHQVTKTSVSGGGLDQGETQEYEVTLKPGKYLYSCPLNPTPDYPIVVEEGNS